MKGVAFLYVMLITATLNYTTTNNNNN